MTPPRMQKDPAEQAPESGLRNPGTGEHLSPIKRPPKIGHRWRRMAEIYRRFAADYPRADFSEPAAVAMYLHESTGAPLPDPRTNGYALGKKWMDVTVAGWKEEIPSRGLLVSELQEDGYPDWFLERVGVLHMRADWAHCGWWLDRLSSAAPALLDEDTKDAGRRPLQRTVRLVQKREER
jgi:hypothetical protein